MRCPWWPTMQATTSPPRALRWSRCAPCPRWVVGGGNHPSLSPSHAVPGGVGTGPVRPDGWPRTSDARRVSGICADGWPRTSSILNPGRTCRRRGSTAAAAAPASQPTKKRPSPACRSVQQPGAHPLKQQRGPLPVTATASVPVSMTPPQLRGRSNSTTVDLAGMGLSRRVRGARYGGWSSLPPVASETGPALTTESNSGGVGRA